MGVTREQLIPSVSNEDDPPRHRPCRPPPDHLRSLPEAVSPWPALRRQIEDEDGAGVVPPAAPDYMRRGEDAPAPPEMFPYNPDHNPDPFGIRAMVSQSDPIRAIVTQQESSTLGADPDAFAATMSRELEAVWRARETPEPSALPESAQSQLEAVWQAREAKPSAAPSQDDRSKAVVMKAAGELASLVNQVPVGGLVTGAMRALAVCIRSALTGSTGESRQGRAYAKDLVAGGLYVAKGWSSGEFEWVYVGSIEGDPARMRIRRDGQTESVELYGDHGLAPYDDAQQGKFWHPTNWTEGTGVGELTGRHVSDAIGQAAVDVVMPPEEDDEF